MNDQKQKAKRGCSRHGDGFLVIRGEIDKEVWV